MEPVLHQPALSVLGADLTPGPAVTVSRREAWSSLAVLAAALLAVLAGAGLAVWVVAAMVGSPMA